MSRPVTGKQSVGEWRVRRPNGDIYVYERTTEYDAETRKGRTVSTRLLGKIRAGESEIVATRPRRRPSSDASGTFRRHAGAMEILDWVGRASNIDEDLRAAFPDGGDAAKIMSIARYMVAAERQSLTELEEWQVMHRTPYEHPIREDTYSDLFMSVGRNEAGIQEFFRNRCSHLDQADVIAFDSTSVSTYSERQIQARDGFNKEGDGLKVIKLLTLYSVKSRQPIAFASLPGNIADVVTVRNALSQVSCLNLANPLLVVDNGYYSERNIARLCHARMRFLCLASKTTSWIRKIVDEKMEECQNVNNTCAFDMETRGCTALVAHEMRIEDGGKTFSRRLRVHVFHNADRALRERSDLTRTVLGLRDRVRRGSELSDHDRELASRYLRTSRRKGVISCTIRKDAIDDSSRYFGYFVIVTNAKVDASEALRLYRLREKIEEMFAIYKGDADGRRPRTWHPDRLRGRQLAQFVALGYRAFLVNRLEAVRDALRDYLDLEASLRKQAGDSEDSRSELRRLFAENGITSQEGKLRGSLLSWMTGRPLHKLLSWFECMEETHVKTLAGQRRWSTEATKRDELFLRLLMENHTEKI